MKRRAISLKKPKNSKEGKSMENGVNKSERNEMPAQEPDVRNKNFDEVALGYSE